MIQQANEQITAAIEFFKRNKRGHGALARRRGMDRRLWNTPPMELKDEQCEFCMIGGILRTCGASIPELLHPPPLYSALALKYPQAGPIIIATAKAMGYKPRSEEEAHRQIDRGCSEIWHENDRTADENFASQWLTDAREHLESLQLTES